MSDYPYQSRLRTCDECGRLGERGDIEPTIVRDGSRYVAVTRCRDRDVCERVARRLVVATVR